MSAKTPSARRLAIHPLSAERWPDLEKLFGVRGACGGCWCMYWRLKRADFQRGKGDGNRLAFRRLVKAGPAPGLLAYAGAEPVGWIALAARDDYPVLERSRVLSRVDAAAVWSITCLFVAKAARRKGVSVQLLHAAVEHVRKCGGKIVEGYPVEPKTGTAPDPFVWTGLASAFRQAGFVEVARRSATRPIMRLVIGRRKRN